MSAELQWSVDDQISWLKENFHECQKCQTVAKNFKYWLQNLKSEDVLLVFVIYDSNWTVFGFWTVDWKKAVIWRRHFGHVEILMSLFHIFFDTFINSLIKYTVYGI